MTQTEDRFFEPYRAAATPTMSHIAEGACRLLEEHEARQRRRSPAHHEAMRAIVEAIVCDVIHRHLTDPGEQIAVSLSNRVLARPTRYRPPIFTKQLRDVVTALSTPEVGVAELWKASQGSCVQRQSTLRAGPWLTEQVQELGVSLHDVRRKDEGETIILKDRSEDQEKAAWVDYGDTATTRRFREQMSTINEWLGKADVTFDQDHAPPGKLVDVRERRLRRIFNRGSFAMGGRMHGAFWIGLSKNQRKRGLRVHGEQVVCLDYGQMAPRILYGMAKAPLPRGDLYGIDGYSDHRSGIKRMFNAMACAGKPFHGRWPKELSAFFSAGTKASEVVQAITNHHRPIADLFFRGTGLKAMFLESEIMIDVLFQLRNQGVVALPVHDCLIVPQSQEDLARDIMVETFERHVGVDAAVDRE